MYSDTIISKKLDNFSLFSTLSYNSNPSPDFLKISFKRHYLNLTTHSSTKNKIYLLEQSCISSQSVHIVKNLNNATLSLWYKANEDDSKHTLLKGIQNNRFEKFLDIVYKATTYLRN